MGLYGGFCQKPELGIGNACLVCMSMLLKLLHPPVTHLFSIQVGPRHVGARIVLSWPLQELSKGLIGRCALQVEGAWANFSTWIGL